MQSALMHPLNNSIPKKLLKNRGDERCKILGELDPRGLLKIKGEHLPLCQPCSYTPTQYNAPFPHVNLQIIPNSGLDFTSFLSYFKRCNEDGLLLQCDWKTCPKVYHLSCLNKEKIPRVKWYCPWHYCDRCGKKSTSFCIHCPYSYCEVR